MALLALPLIGLTREQATHARGMSSSPTPPVLTPRIYLPLLIAPAPPPTSEQRIDTALMRGEVDEETALVHKVFAAFGDERLPGQYLGDDSQVRDSMIMAEVGVRFAALTPATQALLAPFLLPPSAPGSWLELRERAANQPGTQALPAAIIPKREIACKPLT
jgi:hypothetical protein